MRPAHKVAAGSAIVLAICAFVTPSEGIVTRAYRDPAGILTLCIGETEGVKEGDVKTPAECRAMLAQRIPDYLYAVDSLMPGLPDNRRIAYTDFAYNLGPGKLTLRRKDKYERPIPGTSIVDLERAGNWRAACQRMGLFVYAGKVKLAGLVKRRNKEVKLCLSS